MIEGLDRLLPGLTNEEGIELRLSFAVSTAITLLPLPHPSPLNQQYYAKFPQLLQARLNDLAF